MQQTIIFFQTKTFNFQNKKNSVLKQKSIIVKKIKDKT